MKYFLIRHQSDEVRHSLIKLSGLKALTSRDKPRAQSSAHDDFIGTARHCGFPSFGGDRSARAPSLGARRGGSIGMTCRRRPSVRRLLPWPYRSRPTWDGLSWPPGLGPRSAVRIMAMSWWSFCGPRARHRDAASLSPQHPLGLGWCGCDRGATITLRG